MAHNSPSTKSFDCAKKKEKPVSSDFAHPLDNLCILQPPKISSPYLTTFTIIIHEL